MTIKLSTQKDALKKVGLVISNLLKSDIVIEKVNCTVENNSGKLVTRIEIIAKEQNV